MDGHRRRGSGWPNWAATSAPVELSRSGGACLTSCWRDQMLRSRAARATVEASRRQAACPGPAPELRSVMLADATASRPSGAGALAVLFEELRSAREEVSRLRHAPVVHAEQLAARQSLLTALESYVSGLTARGLPIPWKLRDELRLQRGIGGLYDPPAPGRAAAT
jgi:hypothetical protein